MSLMDMISIVPLVNPGSIQKTVVNKAKKVKDMKVSYKRRKQHVNRESWLFRRSSKRQYLWSP